jgi:hypothetical protein
LRNGSGRRSAIASLLKSILHNLGVLIVGFGVAFIGTRIDALLVIRGLASGFATVVGCLLLSLGFFLRVWATFCFYEHRMKVISLEPQKALITSGPYGFSRNPLYSAETSSSSSERRCRWDHRPHSSSPPSTFRWSIFSSGERNGSWRGSSARHGFATRIGCEDGSEPTRKALISFKGYLTDPSAHEIATNPTMPTMPVRSPLVEHRPVVSA